MCLFYEHYFWCLIVVVLRCVCGFMHYKWLVGNCISEIVEIKVGEWRGLNLIWIDFYLGKNDLIRLNIKLRVWIYVYVIIVTTNK